MKKVLTQYGFSFNKDSQDWRKENWIIRFRDDRIEAFNDPATKKDNKYVTMQITMKNLLLILDDM